MLPTNVHITFGSWTVVATIACLEIRFCFPSWTHMSVDYKVEFGCHNMVSINGKGVIVMYAIYGERKTIDEFYYVPSLRCNILSIKHLMDKKYNVC